MHLRCRPLHLNCHFAAFIKHSAHVSISRYHISHVPALVFILHQCTRGAVTKPIILCTQTHTHKHVLLLSTLMQLSISHLCMIRDHPLRPTSCVMSSRHPARAAALPAPHRDHDDAANTSCRHHHALWIRHGLLLCTAELPSRA